MNKSELIHAVAAKTGRTQSATEQTLNALMETVVDAVAQGEGVSLPGFGAFKATQRAERNGRNPATGEAMTLAATTLPKFVAGATFKAKVKG